MICDPAILELIPHRPPMLLIQTLESVTATQACASLIVAKNSAFFVPGQGVPAWVGIEYMGQTAALIAGYQQQQGHLEPHLGLLLGTRKYRTTQPWFREGTALMVSCTEIAIVGDSLATFGCEIIDKKSHQVCANAKLSVYRKPLPEKGPT